GGRLVMETGNALLSDSRDEGIRDAPPGEYVYLTVRDNGIGMPPETRKKIFEPFFTTKRDGKGTGLGLSSVYGIIKQSGGFITVRSSNGRGTAFRIYLSRFRAGSTQTYRRVFLIVVPFWGGSLFNPGTGGAPPRPERIHGQTSSCDLQSAIQQGLRFRRGRTHNPLPPRSRDFRSLRVPDLQGAGRKHARVRRSRSQRTQPGTGVPGSAGKPVPGDPQPLDGL